MRQSRTSGSEGGLGRQRPRSTRPSAVPTSGTWRRSGSPGGVDPPVRGDFFRSRARSKNPHACRNAPPDEGGRQSEADAGRRQTPSPPHDPSPRSLTHRGFGKRGDFWSEPASGKYRHAPVGRPHPGSRTAATCRPLEPRTLQNDYDGGAVPDRMEASRAPCIGVR